MCSTNSAKTATSTSITARLTALYLISTMMILVFTIGFLLQTLVADLEYEDNDFLSERISSIAALIPSHPNTLTALKDQVLIGNSGHHTRYLVRIQDANGHTILESPDMSGVPSDIFPPPIGSHNKIGSGIRFTVSGSSHYLLNSAWAEGFGDSHFRLVQVALDVTDELALMNKFRIKMGIVILASLFIAGGLGIIIARKGLKPLKKMAETVEQITATGLHQRVRSGSWPKELEQLTVALDTMLGRLEESFARLAEFSANLAHELRTPINNLRGEAEIALSRSRSAEEYRKVVESSIEEYERLSRMISDILFLARPEQGIEKSPLNALAEIETLVEYFQSVAEEQQIVVTVKGSGTLFADPRLFQWAAGNIISNALHYTPDGGRITITISPLPDKSLVITVQDTGTGISPNELPLVFDRFYRSASARQRHNQGSGLGLAIVYSIMQLHGGTVALTSELGQGTKVTLQFPQR